MRHGYIKEIYKRSDLQQIRSFLFTGAELFEIDERTYMERLEQESKNIETRLKNTFKDKEELDEVYSELGQSEDTRAEVFFEIGMQIGARFMAQFLYRNE